MVFQLLLRKYINNELIKINDITINKVNSTKFLEVENRLTRLEHIHYIQKKMLEALL